MLLSAERLIPTTKGGPPLYDVERRVIIDLEIGNVIDECIPDDIADALLSRWLPKATDIRIELTMRGALSMYHRDKPDICEMYSKPRVAQEAAVAAYGGVRLKPDWRLVFTHNDTKTSKPWDFGSHECCEREFDHSYGRPVRKTLPMLIIGFLPCTAFSNFQGLSRKKRDAKVVEVEMKRAVSHLEFCMEVYKMQITAGRFSMHEHPHSALFWRHRSVVEIMAMRGVGRVTCAFGMVAVDERGEAPAKKSTTIMSNSPEILKQVDRLCVNGVPNRRDEHHRHVQLVSGRAKTCQIYPRAFCQAVCRGVAAEKKLRDVGMVVQDMMSVKEIMSVIAKSEDGNSAREFHEHEGDEAFDDTSGAPLNLAMVAAARREEI